MQHRHEQALALAERSVELQEESGTPHGLGIALASLGQICVRLGNLRRAEEALNRALDVRSPLQFMRETTGAVFDTLAQIHLIRGEHDEASRSLERPREAYGEYGARRAAGISGRVRVLEARLALRRGDARSALPLAMANDVAAADDAPAAYAMQAELIAIEALLASRASAARRSERLETRRSAHSARRDERHVGRVPPPARPGSHAAAGRATEAYHDFGQSVSVFELLGERYQAGLSYLELGRLAASAGAPIARHPLPDRRQRLFESLGAAPELAETRAGAGRRADRRRPAATSACRSTATMRSCGGSSTRRRCRRCWRGRGRRRCSKAATRKRRRLRADRRRVRRGCSRAAGCDADGARPLRGRGAPRPLERARSRPRHRRHRPRRDRASIRGRIAWPAPFSAPRRASASACSARCCARDSTCARRANGRSKRRRRCMERQLEPLLPGFVCASAAMQRVADQIQRLQGNDLTVLITGESGTGKDLVARAIHAGSLRSGSMFLPYNCTSATRELADSQLFGHRRGSFTGAVADQPGVLRTAVGGTLFLDEVGDLPLDVQPKLLRFLEQGEVLPVGETRPQQVDVRVVAATNADLEQRVAEGKFREDLFYRLSVIRIHVPPLARPA